MQALLGQQVSVLKLSVKMLVVITVFFVQIHTVIGAIVGAVGGLFRGGGVSGMERGAVRGFLFGFGLASLVVTLTGVVLLFTSHQWFSSAEPSQVRAAADGFITNLGIVTRNS